MGLEEESKNIGKTLEAKSEETPPNCGDCGYTMYKIGRDFYKCYNCGYTQEGRERK